MTDAVVLPAGARGLLIEPADSSPRALASALRAVDKNNVAEDIVPAATTVLVVARNAHELPLLRAVINDALASLEQGAEAPMGPLREIRVRYDGPDLPAVARAAHLTVEEVIAAHSDAEHIVEFFGFAPGVAYIKGTPDRIAVPRLPSPRQRIESGTVAITGNQTLIYPGGTPGGWHCIGHTDALLWDVNADSPALLDVGDAIRFVPTAT